MKLKKKKVIIKDSEWEMFSSSCVLWKTSSRHKHARKGPHPTVPSVGAFHTTLVFGLGALCCGPGKPSNGEEKELLSRRVAVGGP